MQLRVYDRAIHTMHVLGAHSEQKAIGLVKLTDTENTQRAPEEKPENNRRTEQMKTNATTH